MVKSVEYITPAVHEKIMTPTGLRVRAISIIPIIIGT